MHSLLARLQNKFIEAFADSSAYRDCVQGTLRYIDRSNQLHGEASTKLMGPKPGTLLQMAEHFPLCSAGGHGVGPPTVTAEVSLPGERRTSSKRRPALLVARSSRRRTSFPLVPGQRAHGPGVAKDLGLTKTNGLTNRTPVIDLSPKLRRRYARVFGSVDGLDQSAKVVDSLKQIS